jgi:hypothetical protein
MASMDQQPFSVGDVALDDELAGRDHRRMAEDVIGRDDHAP